MNIVKDKTFVPKYSGGGTSSLNMSDYPAQTMFLNCKIQAGDSAGVISNNKPGKDLKRYIFINCPITSYSAPPYDTNWGMRCYNVYDWAIVDCDVSYLGKTHEGHGFYLNMSGGLLIQGGDSLKNGGQDIQLTSRPHEGNSPAKNAIIIKERNFYHGQWNPERGASTIAIYNTGIDQDIYIEDCRFYCDWKEAGLPQSKGSDGKMKDSRAAITIVPVKYSKPDWWGTGNPTVFTQGFVKISGNYINHVNPDRHVMSVKGVHSLLVEDNDFNSHDFIIDDPKVAIGVPTGKITFKGNKGSGNIIKAGKMVAKITDNYEFNIAQ